MKRNSSSVTNSWWPNGKNDDGAVTAACAGEPSAYTWSSKGRAYGATSATVNKGMKQNSTRFASHGSKANTPRRA